MFDLNNILRNNIKILKPYSCARDEYKGKEAIFLDANENPYNGPLNRYPDPLQLAVKEKLAAIKGVAVDNIFLGNGSDEAIDILFRAFCEPGVDNVITIHPSYGMYTVAADINDVQIKKVLLNKDFSLNIDALLAAVDNKTKLLFLCSPNNPTANYLPDEEVVKLLTSFNGIVVLDEAYIDFSDQKGMLSRLVEFPNLVILQTFSKAWGMAGLRMGMAFASAEIISIFNKIKPPYNVNILTQKVVLNALNKKDVTDAWIAILKRQRMRLMEEIQQFSFVKKVYPSDANFFLAECDNARKIYEYLVEQKIIVRDRSNLELIEGCLRITVGTANENTELLNALKKYNS